MAVTAKIYGQWMTGVLNGAHSTDFDTDTIKTSLHTSTYTPAQDTDDYWDDATNEVTGTGYTAGGATLGSKTVTYTAGTNVLALDAADATWSSSTITARTAVVYKSTGTSTTSPLICYQQESGDITSTAGTFTVAFNASGIVTLTVS